MTKLVSHDQTLFVFRKISINEYVAVIFQEHVACIENDDGLCDRKGILVHDDDNCEQYKKSWKDKLKALDMLGRHLAMWNDKLQIAGMEEEKSKLDSLLEQISGGG